jgi:putative toxin-antitoxin system antitoxin component (TIGR02293 family)
MTSLASMQDLMGGEDITGPLHTELDLVRLVRRGVPTESVTRFLAVSRLTFPAIERHVLPRRTFKRRQASAQPLDPAESDRLLRLVRLVAAARETFGDPAKALTWLNRENRVLGGETPLAMADTDLGARNVEALLGRIGHGLAA